MNNKLKSVLTVLSNKRDLPKDLKLLIFEYLGIEMLQRETVFFNKKFPYLCVPTTVKFYIPKQVAGFGHSISFYWRVKAGVHNKKELARSLLQVGYFGEDKAELQLCRWCSDTCIVIKLLR
jgi:hypothetical protein